MTQTVYGPDGVTVVGTLSDNPNGGPQIYTPARIARTIEAIYADINVLTAAQKLQVCEVICAAFIVQNPILAVKLSSILNINLSGDQPNV